MIHARFDGKRFTISARALWWLTKLAPGWTQIRDAAGIVGHIFGAPVVLGGDFPMSGEPGPAAWTLERWKMTLAVCVKPGQHESTRKKIERIEQGLEVSA